MLDKNVFLAFMAFWSLLTLSLILVDIFFYYHILTDCDWNGIISRKCNCALIYVLIVPCLIFSLCASLISIDKN